MADFISGYAGVFNSETNIAGAFREKTAPGAFDKSLREYPDVLALWNHNYDRVLGRTAAGTLELRPDRVGLDFTLYADDSIPVRRRDVAGCSFGFTVVRETWEEGYDGQLPLRTVEEAVLWEITLTPLPADIGNAFGLRQRG
ncbi:HK97 family phage prohead protease [Mesorhizobium sp. M1B.F.Ca.ET.045.04.1.1]|uniref:HK97 family phage prohead protease n=1 Tax=Mesorhizobium sp. M1B.F.Ca.ET.045.04.1.1 TaxID=2493673 RepID=UPI001FDF0C41|nr:HK97 family phage prohead protease [Mesorhizobium sp. M1B.F.Ca.ET.045.04.1.1]